MTLRHSLPTLLLSTVAALATASAAAPDRRPPLLPLLRQRGAHLQYDAKRPGRPVIGVTLSGPSVDDALLGRLGELPALNSLIVDHGRITAAGLSGLPGLRRLEEVRLMNMPLADAGLAKLGSIPTLRMIDLTGTQATSALLKSLIGCRELRVLWLGKTQVTDEGLERITAFPLLKSVNLSRTGVTNAGLASLGKLTELDYLT